MRRQKGFLKPLLSLSGYTPVLREYSSVTRSEEDIIGHLFSTTIVLPFAASLYRKDGPYSHWWWIAMGTRRHRPLTIQVLYVLVLYLWSHQGQLTCRSLYFFL